jgi:hypothetical protein
MIRRICLLTASAVVTASLMAAQNSGRINGTVDMMIFPFTKWAETRVRSKISGRRLCLLAGAVNVKQFA